MRCWSLRRPPSGFQSGVTLIELVVAVAVLAILVSIAVPSFREVALNNRASSITNDLLADLSTARSEAVKVAGRAAVLASGATWADGWDVFVDDNGNGTIDDDEEVIKTVGDINLGRGDNNKFGLTGLAGATSGGSGAEAIVFGPMGQLLEPADGARLIVCRPDGNSERSRGIRIDISGRMQAVRDATVLGGDC
ncbi:MAG: GspH/FimT family pseudopilin [Xanthomonadales bacterium]|nr:GspH/FimT family pseudopilin [Xanthomonadales bacterium]